MCFPIWFRLQPATVCLPVRLDTCRPNARACPRTCNVRVSKASERERLGSRLHNDVNKMRYVRYLVFIRCCSVEFVSVFGLELIVFGNSIRFTCCSRLLCSVVSINTKYTVTHTTHAHALSHHSFATYSSKQRLPCGFLAVVTLLRGYPMETMDMMRQPKRLLAETKGNPFILCNERTNAKGNANKHSIA